MAQRKAYQRQLLSPSYNPSTMTEANIYKQQVEGSASMNKIMDQMSTFFFERGMEEIKKEAEIYGATNPISLEDLEKIERGENVLGKYGYGMRGEVARNAAFKVLSNEIEIEASRGFQEYMLEAQQNNYSYEEVADDLDAIALGYTKRLQKINPVTAYNVRSKLSVLSASHYEKYVSQQIKQEQEKQELQEIINIDSQIDEVSTLISGQVAAGNYNFTLYADTLRENIHQSLLNNPRINAADKLKFREKYFQKIDDGIINAIVDHSTRYNKNLSTLASEATNQNIKDPAIQGMYNALTDKSKAEFSTLIRSQLKIENEKATIQSNLNNDILKNEIVDLEQYFKSKIINHSAQQNTYIITDEDKKNLAELKFRDPNSGEKFNKLLNNMSNGFAITDDAAAVGTIKNKFRYGQIEVTDIIENKQKLTADTFDTLLKDAQKYQMTDDIERFKRKATTQKFKGFDYSFEQGVIYTGTKGKIQQLQKEILVEMKDMADQANLADEPFIPENAYKLVIEKLKNEENETLNNIDRMNKHTSDDFNNVEIHQAYRLKFNIDKKLKMMPTHTKEYYAKLKKELQKNKARTFYINYGKDLGGGSLQIYNSLLKSIEAHLKDERLD